MPPPHATAAAAAAATPFRRATWRPSAAATPPAHAPPGLLGLSFRTSSDRTRVPPTRPSDGSGGGGSAPAGRAISVAAAAASAGDPKPSRPVVKPHGGLSLSCTTLLTAECTGGGPCCSGSRIEPAAAGVAGAAAGSCGGGRAGAAVYGKADAVPLLPPVAGGGAATTGAWSHSEAWSDGLAKREATASGCAEVPGAMEAAMATASGGTPSSAFEAVVVCALLSYSRVHIGEHLHGVLYSCSTESVSRGAVYGALEAAEHTQRQLHGQGQARPPPLARVRSSSPPSEEYPVLALPLPLPLLLGTEVELAAMPLLLLQLLLLGCLLGTRTRGSGTRARTCGSGVAWSSPPSASSSSSHAPSTSSSTCPASSLPDASCHCRCCRSTARCPPAAVLWRCLGPPRFTAFSSACPPAATAAAAADTCPDLLTSSQAAVAQPLRTLPRRLRRWALSQPKHIRWRGASESAAVQIATTATATTSHVSTG